MHCNQDLQCNFFNMKQAEHHQIEKHHTVNYGYSQNLYGFSAYIEQGNLMGSPRYFSNPSNHSAGGIYTPKRTHREIETPTWFSVNEKAQSPVHMVNSPVMYGTSGTSIRLEQHGHINAHKGVNYDNPKSCPVGS